MVINNWIHEQEENIFLKNFEIFSVSVSFYHYTDYKFHIKLKTWKTYHKVKSSIIWMHYFLQQPFKYRKILVVECLSSWINRIPHLTHTHTHKEENDNNTVFWMNSWVLNWQNSRKVLLRLCGMTGRHLLHHSAISNSTCLFLSSIVLLYLHIIIDTKLQQRKFVLTVSKKKNIYLVTL